MSAGIVFLLALCVASSTEAKPGAAPPKRKVAATKRRAVAIKRAVPAERPASLHLESVDLVAAKAVVLLDGVARTPPARLFIFRDDRERLFIALAARCQPIAEDPKSSLRCELDLPRPYLKGRILGLSVKIRSREIAAPAEEVAARFAAAVRVTAPPGEAAIGERGFEGSKAEPPGEERDSEEE